MSNPVAKFQNETHRHFEGIVKVMKKHEMSSFTMKLTDISGKEYELSVKTK